MRILFTIANYNTAELLSHLIFSLYRVIGRKTLRSSDILVVDNNSSDGSVEILRDLEAHKLVRVIYNDRQRYHAPALNQGLVMAQKENYDLFWSLDSDTIVLRRRIIRDAVNAMVRTGADMMGQYNDASEAHVSCLLLNMSTAKKLRATFVHGGNPSRYLQMYYAKCNARIRNFPFRHNYYMLHIGCGTRKRIQDLKDKDNDWFGDIADCSPWYHGDPLAPIIHDDFKQLFLNEVPEITPEAVRKACLGRPKITMSLPAESPGPDKNTLSPTARGRLAKRSAKTIKAKKSH